MRQDKRYKEGDAGTGPARYQGWNLGWGVYGGRGYRTEAGVNQIIFRLLSKYSCSTSLV
jgi:hypothetical protein